LIFSFKNKLKSNNEIYKCSTVPLKKEEIKDTTGAGDLFISGFLFGMFQGYSLEQCARYFYFFKNQDWDVCRGEKFVNFMEQRFQLKIGRN
jgi:hypothetical protein